MKSRRKSAFSSFFLKKKRTASYDCKPTHHLLSIFLLYDFLQEQLCINWVNGDIIFFLQNSTSIKSRKLEEFSFNISFIKKELPIWKKMGCFLESTFDYFNKIAKNGLKRKVPIYGVFLLAISSCPIKKQTTGK